MIDIFLKRFRLFLMGLLLVSTLSFVISPMTAQSGGFGAGPGGACECAIDDFSDAEVLEDAIDRSFDAAGGGGFFSVLCPCIVALEAARIIFHTYTNLHITTGFLSFQEWMVEVFFEAHILPAMMMMTEQLTTTAMQQMVMVGMLLDAKHQLETQRLFRQLQAEAHRDYHPSEGLCTIGTTVRSLAASARSAEFSEEVMMSRMQQRMLITGDVSTATGETSDRATRREVLRTLHCQQQDNGLGLEIFCEETDPERRNNDVDVTRMLSRQTSTVDYTAAGDEYHDGAAASPDEVDYMAMCDNLFPFQGQQIPETYLTDEDGNFVTESVSAFMNYRSLQMKKIWASSSCIKMAARMTAGSEDVAPFVRAAYQDTGLPDDEIDDLILNRPSYKAQMDLLTKGLFQDPNFYSSLYDTPANVDRRLVALRMIKNMQKKDMMDTLHRSEIHMSMLLADQLERAQSKHRNEVDQLQQTGVSQ